MNYNITGGNLFNSYNSELYNELDKMRDTSIFRVFKSKGDDYVCEGKKHGNVQERVLHLSCEEAKILKYFLKLNLKQKSSLGYNYDYIIKINKSKYLKLNLLQQHLTKFITSLVDINKNIIIVYNTKYNKDLLTYYQNLLENKRRRKEKINKDDLDLCKDFEKCNIFFNQKKISNDVDLLSLNKFILKTFGNVFVNVFKLVYQNKILNIEDYNLNSYELSLLHQVNTQINLLMKSIADKLNDLVTNQKINELIITNICVNKKNKCSYDIENLSLIRKVFKYLDTFI